MREPQLLLRALGTSGGGGEKGEGERGGEEEGVYCTHCDVINKRLTPVKTRSEALD